MISGGSGTGGGISGIFGSSGLGSSITGSFGLPRPIGLAVIRGLQHIFLLC